MAERYSARTKCRVDARQMDSGDEKREECSKKDGEPLGKIPVPRVNAVENRNGVENVDTEEIEGCNDGLFKECG